MEAIKKYWIWGIFISILSVFAMSYNANAADFGISFDNYTLVRSNPVPYINCQTNTGNITNVQTCSINSNTSGITKLNSIYLNTNQWNNVQVGDIFEFYVNIHTKENNWIQGGSFGIISSYSTSSSFIELLSVEEVSSTVIPFTNTTYSNNPEFFNSIVGFDITQFSRISKVYRVLVRVISIPSSTPYTINIGLQARTQSSLFEYYNFSDIPAVDVHMSNFKQYRYVGNDVNKEQQEKTQEAVDESQDAGDSSTQDAQSGTTGLLNAITGAVSVISSASPTNCKINGNMGNLDIGQLDLCANPAPAFIQTIGSLILILMCVPLAISLFNRFISIFRSFQS